MEIKVVEEKMTEVLASPDNEDLVREYIDMFVSLLEEIKITTDTTNIAVKSVNLDHGVNFIDTFTGLEKKAAQDAWKTIRNNEGLKKKKDLNWLRLMSAFALSALCGDPNTSACLGNIFQVLIYLVKEPKQEGFRPEVLTIIREEFVMMITNDMKLPDWKSIKLSPENTIVLCEIVKRCLDETNDPVHKDKIPAADIVSKWIGSLMDSAIEAKELRDKEKNKPVKKSDELLGLAEFFRKMEDELDRRIIENTNLALEKKELQNEIFDLEGQKRTLNLKIGELEKKIENLESEIKKVNQEVDERKKLNDAQVQYREESQVSLLQDIARSLKAEYGDYAETKDSPMDEMLGEIYREKLKQIFKILEQKGIKVDQ